MRVSMQISLFPSLSPKRVCKRVFAMHYTLTVYIDLKVWQPLYKQDVTKTPKSHKTSQKDIIAAISKQLNAPRDILPLLWWLYSRETKKVP